MNGFVQLIKNLCYLSKFSIKDKILNNPFINTNYHEFSENLLENFLYCVKESSVLRPQIMNPAETVEYLTMSDKSIARFGDGELEIINGGDIPFQAYDKQLALRMKEILQNNQDNLLVGINHSYFYYNYNPLANKLLKDFFYFAIPKYRKVLLKNIDCKKLYCDSGFTVFNVNKCQEIHQSLKKIWNEKNVLVVTCRNLVDNIKYNVFDNVSKLDYIFVPNKNAYSEYEQTLSAIKNYSKDTIVILMCGPLAKVLASDLCALGYRALDLGHIMKSYDYSMRNIEPSAQNLTEFYAPDV